MEPEVLVKILNILKGFEVIPQFLDFEYEDPYIFITYTHKDIYKKKKIDVNTGNIETINEWTLDG